MLSYQLLDVLVTPLGVTLELFAAQQFIWWVSNHKKAMETSRERETESRMQKPAREKPERHSGERKKWMAEVVKKWRMTRVKKGKGKRRGGWEIHWGRRMRVGRGQRMKGRCEKLKVSKMELWEVEWWKMEMECSQKIGRGVRRWMERPLCLFARIHVSL